MSAVRKTDNAEDDRPRLHLPRYFFCRDKALLDRVFFAALAGEKSQEPFLVNSAATYARDSDSEGQSSVAYATYLYQLLYWLRRNPEITKTEVQEILDEAVACGVTRPQPGHYIPQYSDTTANPAGWGMWDFLKDYGL